jgi:putative transposase
MLIMSDYKRYFLPGGTYFFTLKTENNYPVFHDQNMVRLLGEIIRQQIKLNPFQNVAMVLLPDHLHAIWTLPPGDIKYSQRWAWIKKEFTKEYLSAGGVEQEVSTAKQKHRRRGVWQRRFWESIPSKMKMI